MMHLRFVALLGCGLSWLCAAEPTGRYPSPPEAFRDADAIGHARAIVTELLTTKKIPGFSIAVGRKGTVVWSERFGLTDVEKSVAVTPLTRFRLGSVSKVLTAAAIGRLVEDHKLGQEYT